MTEAEKIRYAKMFIDKMANGIDPLTDEPVPEGDMIHQARISRCLFYVSDLLRQMAEEQEVPADPAPKPKRERVSTLERQGQRWTRPQEEFLVDRFQKRVPIGEIAAALKRSEGAVRLRLERLGLLEPGASIR